MFKSINVNPNSVILQISKYIKDIQEAKKTNSTTRSSEGMNSTGTIMQMKWQPPLENFIKINVSAAYLEDNAKARVFFWSHCEGPSRTGSNRALR